MWFQNEAFLLIRSQQVIGLSDPQDNKGEEENDKEPETNGKTAASLPFVGNVTANIGKILAKLEIRTIF